MNNYSRRAFVAVTALSILPGCATAPNSVPLLVNVASVEAISNQAMELRFMAKLRVQNPNDHPIAFSGAVAQLQLLSGAVIGQGVVDTADTIPRFGEKFVQIPITVSAMGELRKAIGLYGDPKRKLDSIVVGRFSGARFDDLRFTWQGEISMTQAK